MPGRPAGARVARYYDPTTAQFLTLDPLVAITRSAYAYAVDTPVSRSDPRGLGDSFGADWDADAMAFGVPPRELVEAVESSAGITSINNIWLDPNNGNIYSTQGRPRLSSQFGCGGPLHEPALGNVYLTLGTIVNHDLGNDADFTNRIFTAAESDRGSGIEKALDAGLGCLHGLQEGEELVGLLATEVAAAVPGLDIGEGVIAVTACVIGATGGVLGVSAFSPSSGG